MDEQLQREEALFDVARQLPSAERGAFLDKACVANTLLRQRVEALLHADDKSGLLDLTAGKGMRLKGVRPTEEPGDIVGRYKLLQQIGEGGCGVVYLAEQQEPIRRRVALKIIKLGMDTRQVVARFDMERQALALMDHPNIAKVLDAGATATGRPYFVMELVRGTRITSYCDERSLSTRLRLELFIQVCRAIQHAHQKGVIHRDIKPSNILVTLQDGEAMPKVIDFGIAKATGGLRLSDQTVFTAFEQFLGTPAYMSPEQAQLTSQDIDTRSDIYSLGVLLYELLTGKTPFDTGELLQTGLDEMLRTVREREPARPSTRLSTMLKEEQTTAARHRNTEPIKLRQALSGDLDWIVMKCLEKNRARRYETANGLAMDIQRHLENEPVMARPPSGLYRFQKIVYRNKALVASVCAVGAALVIGLGLSGWLLHRETEALRRAVAAENSAQNADAASQLEATKSRQVAAALADILTGMGREVTQTKDTKVFLAVLDETAARARKDLGNQPEVQAEIFTIIGNIYLPLGETAKSEAIEREALNLRLKLFGETNGLVADSLNRIARALIHAGRAESEAEAESLTRRALAIWASLPEHDPLEEAHSLSLYGSALQRERRWKEAEQVQRKALEIRRGALKEHGDVASSLHNLALALRGQGRYDEAESLLREGLEMDRRLLGDSHPDVLTFLNSLATSLHDQGKPAEAEPYAREALALRRALYGKEHAKVAGAMSNLASILGAEGKAQEAEPLFCEALAMRRKLLGNESPDVAWSLEAMGSFFQQERRWADAEAPLRELLALRRKLDGDDSMPFAEAANLLARSLVQEGKLAEAEPVARASLGMKDNASSRTLLASKSRCLLGGILVAQGKYSEAEPLLLTAYEGTSRDVNGNLAANKTLRDETALSLAKLYENLGETNKAMTWRARLTESNTVRN